MTKYRAYWSPVLGEKMASEARLRPLDTRASKLELPRHITPTVLTLALASALMLPQVAQAQTWSNTAGTNDWATDQNWSSGSAPNSATVVVIDLAAPSGAVINQAGAQAKTLTVGDQLAGELAIAGVGDLSSGGVQLGVAVGSSGVVSLDGPATKWTDTGTFVIGEGGSGTVKISNGGVLDSAGALVGNKAGSTGAVTLDGAPTSQWTSSQTIVVGNAGQGNLTVLNGQVHSIDAVTVAAGAKAVGIVLIDGATSSVSAKTQLTVGSFGDGSLTLKNGGKADVQAGDAVLALHAGSKGGVLVDGPSTFSQSGSLVVGRDGDGQLQVVNGATAATGANAVLGEQSGKGTATIDGKNSVWTVVGKLTVGDIGGGTVSVTGAGSLSSADVAVLGAQTGSSGNVFIDGKGSNFNVAAPSSLVVGGGGAGTLMITNGATVTSGDSVIGRDPGSKGQVTVDGIGSSWAAGTSLQVGKSGVGQLDVVNGATVTSSGGLDVGSRGVMSVASGGKVDSANGSVGGTLGSSGSLRVDGVGSSWTNKSQFTIGTGVVTVSNGGALAAPTLILGSNGGEVGTLNVGAPSGSTPVGAGTLALGGLFFGDGSGVINFNHTEAGYTFAPELGGSSGKINQIAGVTNITGDASQFYGDTLVTGGRLAVESSLANSSITVAGNGTLGGMGTVGNVLVQAGGTVAPGHMSGSLKVNGNIHFMAGSTYQLNVDAAGQSDRITATGKATLAGEVKVVPAAGSYAPSTQFTILTAGGGVSGQFSGVSSNTAYLTPSLSYDATSAQLTLTRNSTPFSGVSETPNQGSTGAGVESTGTAGGPRPAGISLYDRVLTMDAVNARLAFDQLSGEAYASARGVLIDDSRFVREAAMDRMRLPGTSYGRRNTRTEEGVDVWSRAIGTSGAFNAHRGDRSSNLSAGTAAVDRDLTGMLVGADVDLGDVWRVGVVGGLSQSDMKIDSRNSSVKANSFHLGMYGGANWGAWGLRTGAAYTHHKLETRRQVAFQDFFDPVEGHWNASTSQVFAELGYKLQGERGVLEPFANVAHVNVSSGRFNERGGQAALTGLAGSTGVTFSTLGLRGATRLNLGNASNVTLSASVGWGRAFGQLVPQSSMALAGGSPYTVSGVPIAKNVAVVEAAMDFALSRNSKLSISYGGQFGSGTRDHGVKATLNVRF